MNFNINIPLCRCCKAEIAEADVFCTACGYPLQGTEQEQWKYIAAHVMKRGDVTEAKILVKKARNTLIAVAFIMAVLGLILGVTRTFEVSVVIYYAGAALAYGLLAWWSERNPFAALLTGLVVYASLILLDVVADPSSIFKGIIFKIIIISLLVKGVIGASKLKGEKI